MECLDVKVPYILLTNLAYINECVTPESNKTSIGSVLIVKLPATTLERPPPLPFSSRGIYTLKPWVVGWMALFVLVNVAEPNFGCSVVLFGHP